MREILFRGKRLDNNEWVYGNYFHYNNKNYNEGLGCFYIQTKLDKETLIEDFEVIPETIGQHTGLTDKNGNKIFEGDIVEYQYVICEEDGVGMYENPVTFENGCFCIDGDSDFTLSYAILSSDEYGGLKVIGNIHDNPELWKGGEQ